MASGAKKSGTNKAPQGSSKLPTKPVKNVVAGKQLGGKKGSGKGY